MSKALVIKGANFAANKVTTVTVSEPIPCTGISLSASTASLTSIGATVTLTATKTPANTTDEVVWVSSNSNVASISNGVVTSLGAGVVTITATCGTQSATCTVTCTATLDMTNIWIKDKYEMSGADFTVNPPKDYVSLYANNTRRVYGYSENSTGGRYAFTGAYDFGNAYPIKLPIGTTKISATFPTDFIKYRIMLIDSQNAPTYSIIRAGARVVVAENTTDVSNGAFEYTIPAAGADADSFLFLLRTNSTATDQVTGDVTVTFA